MQQDDGLRFGVLDGGVVHLCVDVQRLFAEDTPWKTPWIDRVLPKIVEITADHASETIFTRFIPARSAADSVGAWRRYWRRWEKMTLSNLSPDMVNLVADISHFTPPAVVIDKRNYSPWMTPELPRLLRQHNIHTLIITGGETDICVLATALGAIDRGFRVILASDALCSSADETHDAMLKLYRSRFSQQIETATTEQILDAWR
jgi:nicotinamidase-related amidase